MIDFAYWRFVKRTRGQGLAVEAEETSVCRIKAQLIIGLAVVFDEASAKRKTELALGGGGGDLPQRPFDM